MKEGGALAQKRGGDFLIKKGVKKYSRILLDPTRTGTPHQPATAADVLKQQPTAQQTTTCQKGDPKTAGSIVNHAMKDKQANHKKHGGKTNQ